MPSWPIGFLLFGIGVEWVLSYARVSDPAPSPDRQVSWHGETVLRFWETFGRCLRRGQETFAERALRFAPSAAA